MAILVVGSVALDTVETPFGRADETLGGAAAYFIAAAALYDRINLVAVVGDDFPNADLDYLRSCNTDVAGLQVVPGRTFRWGARYAMDMNSRQTLFTELGVFGDFHPVVPESFRQSQVVFLANIQPELQLDVLRQIRQTHGTRASASPAGDGAAAPLVALDTMNFWIASAREALTAVLREVDVVLLAEDEVRQYAQTPSLRAGARQLFELGPKLLVIKQGSYGALLLGADGSYFAAPSYPLEDVRDPTGAGDAFAGGFLGYLASVRAQGRALTVGNYRRALVHGNIMGSFACEDFSVDRLRHLAPGDIAARYREFVEFTHFEGSWQGDAGEAH